MTRKITVALAAIAILIVGMAVGSVAFPRHVVRVQTRVETVRVTAPNPGINYVCIDYHTYLTRGSDGLAEDSTDNRCAPSKAAVAK